MLPRYFARSLHGRLSLLHPNSGTNYRKRSEETRLYHGPEQRLLFYGSASAPFLTDFMEFPWRIGQVPWQPSCLKLIYRYSEHSGRKECSEPQSSKIPNRFLSS